MNKNVRYTVKTRYGVFSLDEGSYQDYLAGKLWICWPPRHTSAPAVPREPQRPEASPEAIRLRDLAAKSGIAEALQGFAASPSAAYRNRFRDLPIYELNLSARSYNGLMRAGVRVFCQLNQLIRSDRGLLSVRNLGTKSVTEIHDAFLAECYGRLSPGEQLAFWQDILDANGAEIA